MTEPAGPTPIWRELAEAAPNGEAGWIRRRLPTAGVRVHLAVDTATRYPSLMVDLPIELASGLGELPNTGSLSVTLKHPAGLPADQRALTIELVDSAFLDLFAVFCGDLAARLATCRKPQDAATILLERVQRWQEFLAAARDGLGRHAIVGLFGELAFLLDEVVPAAGIGMVRAWTGADRQPQDFVIPTVCAIETKTTTSPRMEQVRINGERQLDNAGLHSLFLVCLRLEEVASGGRSLPELVEGLRAAAGEHVELRAALDMRLGMAGFVDRHARRYDASRFAVAESLAFEVADGFPRVTPQLLPPGIGDVRYVLDLRQCSAFSRGLGTVRARLSALQLEQDHS